MTDLSAQGRANRRRGADAERAVVRYLRPRWPDCRRYLAGDGRQPGDVEWHPLVTLEVKDSGSSAWPSWCRQVRDECRPGTAAVVVRRLRGNPDVGWWEARVHDPSWTEAVGELKALAVLSWVDGDAWHTYRFADVARLIWLLDHPEDCYLPDGAA